MAHDTTLSAEESLEGDKAIINLPTRRHARALGSHTALSFHHPFSLLHSRQRHGDEGGRRLPPAPRDPDGPLPGPRFGQPYTRARGTERVCKQNSLRSTPHPAIAHRAVSLAAAEGVHVQLRVGSGARIQRRACHNNQIRGDGPEHRCKPISWHDEHRLVRCGAGPTGDPGEAGLGRAKRPDRHHEACLRLASPAAARSIENEVLVLARYQPWRPRRRIRWYTGTRGRLVDTPRGVGFEHGGAVRCHIAVDHDGERRAYVCRMDCVVDSERGERLMGNLGRWLNLIGSQP